MTGLVDEVSFGPAAAGSAGSERVLVLLQTGTQSSTGMAVYSERLGLGLVYEVKYITSSCRIRRRTAAVASEPYRQRQQPRYAN